MDETKVTPESEVNDSNVETTEEVAETKTDELDTEKSVESKESDAGDKELQDALPEVEVSKTKEPETVPLKNFLELKKDLKELKKDLKEAKSSNRSSAVAEGVKDLSAKYPDVSPEFIEDILNSAKSSVSKEIDSKYAPIIQKQQAKEQLERFNTAFDKVYDKAIEENPSLPKSVDKELIKTLVKTPEYRNVKVADILTKIYGNVENKEASEDDTTIGTGDVETIKSFDKITPEQRKTILENPKSRKEYYNWLDTQIGR